MLLRLKDRITWLKTNAVIKCYLKFMVCNVRVRQLVFSEELHVFVLQTILMEQFALPT